MGRLQKREEIRTGSIFGTNSKIDEEVQKLKKKMGSLPQATRKLLKAQMTVISFKNVDIIKFTKDGLQNKLNINLI